MIAVLISFWVFWALAGLVTWYWSGTLEEPSMEIFLITKRGDTAVVHSVEDRDAVEFPFEAQFAELLAGREQCACLGYVHHDKGKMIFTLVSEITLEEWTAACL